MKKYAILFLASAAFACASTRREIDTSPVHDSIAETRSRELVERGDGLLQENHLYGWRQAEPAYERADRLVEKPEIRDRLALTRFLIITRELDERIFYERHLERLAKLCDRTSTTTQIRLCQAAREKLRLAGVIEDALASETTVSALKLPGSKGAELADYVGLEILEAAAPELFPDRFKKFLADYPDSLLGAYLRLKQPGFVERFPDKVNSSENFAELLFSEGFRLLDADDFRQGFDGLNRGFELLPDHISALTDLANIYLYSLGMALPAKDLYSRALESDDRSTPARFGLGIALHQLGNHLESNIALDQVLSPSDSRWQTLTSDERVYFQGIAHYYKAYNFYLLGLLDQARISADSALHFQPDLKSVRYLSGILYVDRGLDQKAESEFERVTDGGTELCDAYYRLGRIQGKRDEASMLRHFMNSAICLDRRVNFARSRLESVDALEIDSESRERLRKVREMDFSEQRSTALASLVSMLDQTGTSNSIRSVACRDLIENVLANLEAR